MGNLIQNTKPLAWRMQDISNSYILEFESVEFDKIVSEIKAEAEKGNYSYSPKYDISAIVLKKLKLNDFKIEESRLNQQPFYTISWNII